MRTEKYVDALVILWVNCDSNQLYKIDFRVKLVFKGVSKAVIYTVKAGVNELKTG